MTWIENINNINNNQDKMVLLNNNHNGKVIFLDSNKVYDTKTGNMLKTGDNKYVSKKVIKNKKNKLVWRHIFSYLNMDNIELINQYIYMDLMKHKVFGIAPKVGMGNYNWDLNSFVEELYDCKISWSSDNQETKNRKKKIQEEEYWVEVEYYMVDNSVVDRSRMYSKNYREIGWKCNRKQNGYVGIEHKCKFIKSNGDMCLNGGYNQRVNITNIDYIIPLFRSLECCGIHKNQYNKLNEEKKHKKIVDITTKLGYVLKNGVMCKV